MYIQGKEKPGWKPSDLCVILDTVTGKPQRFCGSHAVMTLEDAKHHLESPGIWIDRSVIVRLDCWASG